MKIKLLVIISLSILYTTKLLAIESFSRTSNSSDSLLFNPNSTKNNEEYLTLAKKYQKKANYYRSLIGLDTIEADYKVPKYNPWHNTQVSLGGGNTKGNVTSTNLQGNLNINYKPSPMDPGWSFSLLSQYNYLSSSTKCNEVDRFYAQHNTNYMFDKYNGTFAQISYLNDLSGGYYFVVNENIGYQLQLFKNLNSNLILSFGPGLQQRKVATQSKVIENALTWLTQGLYNLNISKLFSFQEQLQNVSSSLNSTTTSSTILSLKTFDKLSVSFSYQVIYNSKPERNSKPLDTLSSVNLAYSI